MSDYLSIIASILSIISIVVGAIVGVKNKKNSEKIEKLEQHLSQYVKIDDSRKKFNSAKAKSGKQGISVVGDNNKVNHGDKDE